MTPGKHEGLFYIKWDWGQHETVRGKAIYKKNHWNYIHKNSKTWITKTIIYYDFKCQIPIPRDFEGIPYIKKHLRYCIKEYETKYLKLHGKERRKTRKLYKYYLNIYEKYFTSTSIDFINSFGG